MLTSSTKQPYCARVRFLAVPSAFPYTVFSMSSPTAYTRSFKPSRPAPAPPTTPPAYTPETPSYRTRTQSTTSIDSESTLYTPESRPVRISRHTSPPSPLNTRLTPPRAVSYPPLPTRAEYFASPPADLSLFDHRQRQTLLGDIEFIIGKKLHFPMLSRKDKAAASTAANTSAAGSVKGKKADQGGKLRKERRISDDDLFWSGVRVEREEVVVVQAAPGDGRRKGRGVREGNWI